MESLGEAYTSSRFEGRDPRRVYAGAALAATGVLAIVAGVLVVATPLGDLLGAGGRFASRTLGGVLAGLGIPASLLGVVVVLPASRRERLGVVAGTACCVAGVWLFTRAYPMRWTTGADALAFPTTMTYFVGGCVAFWFVLTAVADYRVRNNPTGTVDLELEREGRTRTVQLSRDEYRRYKRAVRSDGGETEQVIRELESRFEE